MTETTKQNRPSTSEVERLKQECIGYIEWLSTTNTASGFRAVSTHRKLLLQALGQLAAAQEAVPSADAERLNWEFLEAYYRACDASQPGGWHAAAMAAKRLSNSIFGIDASRAPTKQGDGNE